MATLQPGDQVIVANIGGFKEDLVLIAGQEAGPDTSLNLDDLGDVVISSVAAGQLVTWNGSQWVNAAPAALTLDGLSDVTASGSATGKFLRKSAGDWTAQDAALDDLSDVVITSPATGHRIQHNGTNFVNSATIDVVSAATTTDAVTMMVTGDSQKRLIINGDGGIEWGSGSGATDATLARAAAGQLDTIAFIRSIRTGAVAGFVTAQSGDSVNRWAAYTSGLMEWGSGSATRDTNLYRSAADTLKTDDALTVVGAFSVGSGPVQIDPASPATGHLLRYNGTKFVSVAEEANAQYPNHVSVRNTSVNQTGITSTSYVDVTGMSVSFTKNKAGTGVRLAFAMSFYVGDVNQGVYFAAQINGTDYELARMIPSLVTSRSHMSGFHTVTGIAAGTYTVKLRVKASSASYVINMDSNDMGSLEVTEVK